jgi:HEAT repeat protein
MYSQAQGHISSEGEASMDLTAILSLLEKPTRNRWGFVYQIRDEAAVADIVAALRASTQPHTRDLLCYILNLRAGAEFFEGRSSETKQAVPALIEALADLDADVRDSAIDALGHIGDPAAGPALLQEYHKEHDDSGLRVSLAFALGFCQYAPAIPTLIGALPSPNGLLRRQATWGLRHLQAQEAKEPLRKALAQETDPLTRQTMQETLQEFEHPSTYEEKTDRLIARLRNAETADEREAAATALGDMDKRVLPSLLALLHDKQCDVRQYATVAISALSEHRDAAWFVRAYREQVQEPLIQMLADRESNVRAAAAQALGQWGDERAVEPLLAVIQDADVEVRTAVVAALNYPKDERTLEPLLTAFFTDDDLQVRLHAAEALGRHSEDSRAVNALIQALQDEQSDRRQQAAELLCWLKDERATDALIQALQDTDSAVREWSIEALWELCLGKNDDLSAETTEKMRGPLMQALQDPNSEVRECAAKIVAWLD